MLFNICQIHERQHYTLMNYSLPIIGQYEIETFDKCINMTEQITSVCRPA